MNIKLGTVHTGKLVDGPVAFDALRGDEMILHLRESVVTAVRSSFVESYEILKAVRMPVKSFTAKSENEYGVGHRKLAIPDFFFKFDGVAHHAGPCCVPPMP